MSFFRHGDAGERNEASENKENREKQPRNQILETPDSRQSRAYDRLSAAEEKAKEKGNEAKESKPESPEEKVKSAKEDFRNGLKVDNKDNHIERNAAKNMEKKANKPSESTDNNDDQEPGADMGDRDRGEKSTTKPKEQTKDEGMER